jgi:MFS family permease
MVFIVLFVQFLNMCFFSHYNTPLTVLVGSSLTGFCYGAGMSLFPLLSVDFYGLKNAGVNYGLLYSAMGVAGIFGPVMAAWSVDETSSYQLAYRIIAGLLVISLVFVWLIKRQYSAHLVAKQLSRR